MHVWANIIPIRAVIIRGGVRYVTDGIRLEGCTGQGPPDLLHHGIGLWSRYVPYVPRDHIKLGHGLHEAAV
eukprot:2013912-Prorocentrum_lima.AAC.1